MAQRLKFPDVMHLLEEVADGLGLQPAQRWELGRLEMDHPVDHGTVKPLPDESVPGGYRLRIRRPIWLPADGLERAALAGVADPDAELALITEPRGRDGLVVDHTTPLLVGVDELRDGFGAALASVAERACAGIERARAAVRAAAGGVAPERAALLHTLFALTDARAQTVGHALRLRFVGVDTFGLDILPDRYPVLLWLAGDELSLATLPFGCPSGLERARLETLLGPVLAATRESHDFELGSIDVDAALWPAFMTKHPSTARDVTLAETIWSHAEVGRAIAAVQGACSRPLPSALAAAFHPGAPHLLRA